MRKADLDRRSRKECGTMVFSDSKKRDVTLPDLFASAAKRA